MSGVDAIFLALVFREPLSLIIFSSLTGFQSAPRQVLGPLYSPIVFLKVLPLIFAWLVLILFLVINFLDLIVLPYGGLFGLLSNWLLSNDPITTHNSLKFLLLGGGVTSSVGSSYWIVVCEWGWGVWGWRRVFKIILMGLRVEAERKHPFTGEQIVERTEVLLVHTLLKKRLPQYTTFMKSWNVMSFLSMVID